jgi:hypothetical protein
MMMPRQRTPLGLAVVFAVASSIALLGLFAVLAFGALVSLNGYQSGDPLVPAITAFGVLVVLTFIAHNVVVILVSRRFSTAMTLGLTVASLLCAFGVTCVLTLLVGATT